SMARCANPATAETTRRDHPSSRRPNVVVLEVANLAKSPAIVGWHHACIGLLRSVQPTERSSSMAYVVCEPCHDCKYTDCVVVCPCNCFYQDDTMLYIDPVECIDCEACVPECPADAIF